MKKQYLEMNVYDALQKRFDLMKRKYGEMINER